MHVALRKRILEVWSKHTYCLGFTAVGIITYYFFSVVMRLVLYLYDVNIFSNLFLCFFPGKTILLAASSSVSMGSLHFIVTSRPSTYAANFCL